METTEFDRITADQLTHIRSLDFARLIGLQAKFAGNPDPHWYALRNFRDGISAVAPCGPRHESSSRSRNNSRCNLGRTTSRGSTVGGRIYPVGACEVPSRQTRPAARTGRTRPCRWKPRARCLRGSGENKPKLLSAPAFATLSLPWAKAAGIIAVSDEVLALRAAGQRDVAPRGAGQRHAVVCRYRIHRPIDRSYDGAAWGLANGSPTAAASGTTSAAAATDIQAMVNAFVLVNPSLEDARFVMSPSVAIAVARADDIHNVARDRRQFVRRSSCDDGGHRQQDSVVRCVPKSSTATIRRACGSMSRATHR